MFAVQTQNPPTPSTTTLPRPSPAEAARETRGPGGGGGEAVRRRRPVAISARGPASPPGSPECCRCRAWQWRLAKTRRGLEVRARERRAVPWENFATARPNEPGYSHGRKSVANGTTPLSPATPTAEKCPPGTSTQTPKKYVLRRICPSLYRLWDVPRRHESTPAVQEDVVLRRLHEVR